MPIEPRMSSTPNCHDDGHVWSVIARDDDGTIIDMCVRCGQTRAQVDAYEASKRQVAPLPPITEDDLKIWGSPERPDEKIFD